MRAKLMEINARAMAKVVKGVEEQKVQFTEVEEVREYDPTARGSDWETASTQAQAGIFEDAEAQELAQKTAEKVLKATMQAPSAKDDKEWNGADDAEIS